MDKTILIVEDDQELGEVLRSILQEAGYIVRIARDGVEALQMVQQTHPDLVVLDLGLPTLSGETVCLEIKKNYSDIPVIILTARNHSQDIVKGLNLGADDYIPKPFETDVLIARINARLRTSQPDNSKYVIDDLVLNNQTLEVKRGKKTINLSPQEFRILSYLMANKGRVLTREMILSRLWRNDLEIETRVVDVYIGYLRKKIDVPFDKKLIHSVRGFGYKIAG